MRGQTQEVTQEKASYGAPAYFAGMPLAEIKSKQAVYTLLHTELAGKLLANKREVIRLRTPCCRVKPW
jgi:hypothetical protein